MAVITSERSIPGLPADAGTLAQRSLDSKQNNSRIKKAKTQASFFPTGKIF